MLTRADWIALPLAVLAMILGLAALQDLIDALHMPRLFRVMQMQLAARVAWTATRVFAAWFLLWNLAKLFTRQT